MNYIIRPLTQDDEPFLWQMLYEAAHMAEEGNLTVQDAMNNLRSPTSLRSRGSCCSDNTVDCKAVRYR